MHNNVIVTVYHDKIEEYFYCFLKSLRDQSFKNFEVLIFDDSRKGIKLKNLNPVTGLEVIRLPKMSLLENRLWIFNYLKEKTTDIIHFCDGDDTLNSDYIACTQQYFRRTNIIVHDFNLMDTAGIILKKNYWSSRVGNGFMFDHEFIKNKNLLGLGNTSISKKLLDNLILEKSNIVTIPDWFIFTQLMLKMNEVAIFIKHATFNYRQHENLTDLENYSFNKLKQSIKHVFNHFSGLIEIGLSNDRNLVRRLENLFNNFSLELYYSYKKQREKRHFFWWEEVFTILRYYEHQNI